MQYNSIDKKNLVFLTENEKRLLERNERIVAYYKQLKQKHPQAKDTRIFCKIGTEYHLSSNHIRTIIKNAHL